MEEKIVKSTGSDAPPDIDALVSQVTQQLHQSYQELERKLSEVSQILDSTCLELKQTQQEKQKVSLFLDNILDSMTSGVVVLDLEGKIVLFNKAAEKVTGYNICEIQGRRYSEVFSVNQEPEFSPVVTLREGKSFSHQEKEFRTKNGRNLTLGFSTSPLQDSTGAMLGVVEVFIDLSKVKRLEEELARVKTLAAVGEMAAMVSHEIRNPLGGIAGFADLLDRDTPAHDPRKKYIQKIIEGVEILNKNVGNLLAYSRSIQLTPRQIQMTGFLDGVIGLFEMELRRSQKKITVGKNYLKQNVVGKIDPEQFQQVILNLLQNSAHAIAEQGTIELTLDSVSSGQEPMLYLKVSDNGLGMPPEVLKKIFTPFFTSTEYGTGLGLATVKKVVEAHRGEVKIKSASGKGTEVEIWIPQW